MALAPGIPYDRHCTADLSGARNSVSPAPLSTERVPMTRGRQGQELPVFGACRSLSDPPRLVVLRCVLEGMRDVRCDGGNIIGRQVEGRHHLLAVCDGLVDLLRDIVLPELGIGEVNRVLQEGFGRRSLSVAPDAMAKLAFGPVECSPLVVPGRVKARGQ